MDQKTRAGAAADRHFRPEWPGSWLLDGGFGSWRITAGLAGGWLRNGRGSLIRASPRFGNNRNRLHTRLGRLLRLGLRYTIVCLDCSLGQHSVRDRDALAHEGVVQRRTR